MMTILLTLMPAWHIARLQTLSNGPGSGPYLQPVGVGCWQFSLSKGLLHVSFGLSHRLWSCGMLLLRLIHLRKMLSSTLSKRVCGWTRLTVKAGSWQQALSFSSNVLVINNLRFSCCILMRFFFASFGFLLWPSPGLEETETERRCKYALLPMLSEMQVINKIPSLHCELLCSFDPDTLTETPWHRKL